MLLNWKSKDYLYYKISQFIATNDIGVNTDLEELCKDKGWHLIHYPKDKSETLKSISNDGFTIKDGNDFYIMYNPKLKKDCFERFRFTIAHEMGHIFMYHHIYVKNSVLMHGYDKNLIWEQQANIFAQNILMPIKYRDFYKNSSLRTICDKFCVSSQMASTRLNKLYKDELFSRRLNTKIKNNKIS